ncbi:MAG: hypothetical protein A2Y91_03475 [Chloroflexi bacterium RBG_13_54_8]|nr:MAG: hypothetical protein A2Y91_03475 [Chloroflexi bacterium RBG_13_54_8]
MRKELIDGHLLTSLSRFYPSVCDIQTYTDENQDSYGQPNPLWIDFVGHVDIPCALSAAKGQEVKNQDMTIGIATHIIALAGYYPTITYKMRAVIDSQNYDILLCETDSHVKMTRLTCQIVS